MLAKILTFFQKNVSCGFTEIMTIFYGFGVLGLILFFLFKNVFSFNYEVYHNHHYDLAFFVPILILPILSLYRGRFLLNHSVRLGLLLIPLVAALLCFSKYYGFSNEYFYNVSLISIFCYGVFMLRSVNMIYGILIAIFVLFFVEVYLGLSQITHGMELPNLSIVGSLQNSGIYALYLTLNLPLIYYVCFNLSRHYSLGRKGGAMKSLFKIIFVLSLLGVSCIIYYTQSRTAIITLFGLLVFSLSAKYKSRILGILDSLPKFLSVFTGVITIGGIGWIGSELFHLKKMSAIGRLLSSEITLQHTWDHIWTGVGIGRFTWYYPQWQSEYFSFQPRPNLNYFLSASEIYIIHNEYLQLFITIGIFGFLVLCYALYKFFNLTNTKNGHLLFVFKCTVFGALCSALTSYSLHVNIVLLLVGFCVASAFALNYKDTQSGKLSGLSVLNKCFLAFIGICIMILTYQAHLKRQAIGQWKTVRQANQQNLLQLYKDIYPVLKNDGKFMTDYARMLLRDKKSGKIALTIAQRSQDFIITRQSTETLIDAVCQAKQYRLAVDYQMFLVNYLPNKFLPKYNLMLLYELYGDVTNTVKTARIILSMPVKIPSSEVQLIKRNTQRTLERYL